MCAFFPFPAPPSPFNPNGIRVRPEKHPVTLSPGGGTGLGDGDASGWRSLSHPTLALAVLSAWSLSLLLPVTGPPPPQLWGLCREVPSSRKLPLTAGSPLPQGTLSFSQFVSLVVGLCFLGTGTMSRCIHPWPSRRAHAPGPLVTTQRTCGGCEPWGRVKARLDAFWGALCVCPGRTVWGVIPWLWCVLAGGLRASQRTPWSSHVLLCKLETQAAALHVVGGVSNCVGCRAQCGHVVRPTWWPFSSLWFRREHRGLVVRRNQTLHGARGLVEEGPEPCVALSREGRSEMSSYFTPLLYG